VRGDSGTLDQLELVSDAGANGGSSAVIGIDGIDPGALPRDGTRLSAFTVDVEDWYQSCVDLDAPITERVVHNVERLLGLLDVLDVKGTFFVQGRVAETYPGLIQTLVAEGHEIQSHGYSHRRLDTMNRRELQRELEYAKKTVEDASGVHVTAFRAPDFSIVKSNLWALEALAEAGFEVDSSLFPARSARYGLPGWELGPHRLILPSGNELLEVPVAIWPVAGLRLPVAGGGYWRVLPRPLLERGIRAIQARERPVILYCHPYEFNPRELDDYRGQIRPARRLSQSMGRNATIKRFTRLMGTFPFGRFDETLSAWGLA
jgi:polysaccharide deacetylase family protein (PEP-CTERM system associated)